MTHPSDALRFTDEPMVLYFRGMVTGFCIAVIFVCLGWMKVGK